MPKTILITGAGSGFGEAAAIGMARNGHTVIATVQVAPQVTPLREKAKALGLDNLRVERLDLTTPTTSPRRRASTSTCCGTMRAWARRGPSSRCRSTSSAATTR
jgi:NAD(P)-dependent dehydrogenase (short-subunit alcohol dehydrogenase family)